MDIFACRERKGECNYQRSKQPNASNLYKYYCITVQQAKTLHTSNDGFENICVISDTDELVIVDVGVHRFVAKLF